MKSRRFHYTDAALLFRVPDSCLQSCPVCLLVLLALGLAERVARDRALAALPIRIHVNGTRAKSTVTRLIWSALLEAGIPAVAKTTGTAPRLLLPDGREVPLRRRGPANIREQLAFAPARPPRSAPAPSSSSAWRSIPTCSTSPSGR